MTTTYKKNMEVLGQLHKVAPKATLEHAILLRRAAMTLHAWYEHECNGAIQRDEKTDVPYWWNTNTCKRIYRSPDREKGAIKRIEHVCADLGLKYYLQGDPRGGTLYVDNKPIPENNYNRAVFIA